MEPSFKKRKLQGGQSDKKRPGKRPKTGGRPAKKARPTAPKAGFRKLDAAALPWQQDIDGVLGLQAIEGVDIIKDGDKVQFFVPESGSAPPPEETDKEEFEGFDDLPPVEDELAVAEQTEDPKSKGLEAKNNKKKEKVTAKKAAPSEDDTAIETSNPIPETDVSAWAALNLSPTLLTAIAHLKFSNPTAIQAQAIPEILEGHDVIGKASTGSGKTLAFTIPIVEKWLEAETNGKETEAAEDEEDDGVKVPLALVLSPTRELAHQLVVHIKALCEGLPRSPYVCSVTGGLSVLKQQRQLSKADIVVATPGRLWEVISTDIPLLQAFKQIKFLVVDEADRLLSEGHFKEAEEIIGALDREELGFDEDEHSEEDELSARQTLVFSATFNKALQQKLAGKAKYNLLDQEQSMEYLLKKLNFREEKPKFIDVNPVSQMAEKLKEGLVECGPLEKDLFLYAVLMLNPCRRTLVFTNSIAAVRRLSPMLQNLNLKVHPLHSQMIQKARLRSIERFASSNPRDSTILVSTDVAARGLDIPNVDQVIHYHVPRAADAYVHRSGRTARGENSGVSILLCSPDEVIPTRRLVAKVHQEKAANLKHLVRTIDIDRRVVSKLKPRLTLAKKIADATIAKDKDKKEDNWVKAAAEELGVEYDSEELEQVKSWAGRGSGKKQKEREAAQLSKAELGALRAQLRELLERKVNTGVSERYITGGRVDIEALLKADGKGDFLGQAGGLLFDDD
ncbi:hypothetical protein jhhlp_003091 [Lomentospora prolificans]|uniref:ATP-dependent RNA helicase n=1 Tax=Lomentospora prolificans TaxID=41688 RepID=A0A2N3NFV7_9PEZI|nr:hypothetical protein jhhlp_003091 [Lomentospora prolificans]